MAFEKKAGHAIIFLLGPTAVGKTDFSFHLAEYFSASILNCDSIQMYKGLDIGSAKPDRLTKQKQFLFDEWDPPFVCTAGVFRKTALSILEKELPHRPVLAVGGSGFYVQALEKGMYDIKPVKQEIKKRIGEIQNKRGSGHLYQLLQFLDPEYAKRISPHDTYRIFRAISIILSEEKPLSLIRSSFRIKELSWPYLKIGLYLKRETLLKRVTERTEKMIKAGLLEEVQDLLNKGLLEWPVLKSVGYKESVLFLQNKISKEEWKMRIVYRTMRLAKKQLSWFKRDKGIKWYLSESKNWLKIQQDIKKYLSENKIKVIT